MKNTRENRVTKRVVANTPTEAAVKCWPFASSDGIHAVDGVMRNFSNQEFYIETNQKYKSGTPLIVRLVS